MEDETDHKNDMENVMKNNVKNVVIFTRDCLFDDEIKIDPVSMDGIIKVFSRILQYIYNNTILIEVNTKEKFNEFMEGFFPLDLQRSIKENGEKIMNDYNEELVEGPVYDYFFNSVDRNNVDNVMIRNINYAVGCMEFLCCNLFFSFKDKTLAEIDKILNKNNEMLMKTTSMYTNNY